LRAEFWVLEPVYWVSTGANTKKKSKKERGKRKRENLNRYPPLQHMRLRVHNRGLRIENVDIYSFTMALRNKNYR
jgi:hypothetical protein